jgi:ABC-type multidrug transport system ATPase subunit
LNEETAIGIEGVALRDGLVFGRSAEADVVLADPSVSRRHLALRRGRDGWEIEDLGSKSGSWLNGRLFQREPLTYGDVLALGPFAFRFDGCELRRTNDKAGASVRAVGLMKTAGTTRVLDGISLAIEPGQFIGVIGPSGAGKSTLLDALCALRPADSGDVFIDGRSLYADPGLLRDEFGYVPQDDIVPLELSVEEALGYSARLRLPRNTPAAERRRLVARTIAELGLAERAGTRVGRLSGGQRKRVSVAAELLSRPRLLFLDEPTSGLDPRAEFALMEVLRRLAANGCTIVCTTHVMENAYLMDRLVILRAGRLAFFGEPEDARTHFGVERLTQIYEQLGGAGPAPEWTPPVVKEPEARPTEARAPSRRPAALPILLRREWATLVADWKNLALALGQPVLIGALVTWVSSDAALILFFAYIATLWFGCGNAAQEIVKELPMFRRERLIGLGRHAYLLAKTLSLARLTVAQSLLTYGVMQLGAWIGSGHAIGGAVGWQMGWQMGALIATSFAAVGIGLAISALARSVLQAVMLVPLVLIPQILFSGFTPPAGELGAGPYAVSRVMPSAAAQGVMDVSLLWGRKVTGYTRVDFPSAFSNLNRGHALRNGQVFANAGPAWAGLGTLVAWVLATYAVAWASLRKRERG